MKREGVVGDSEMPSTIGQNGIVEAAAEQNSRIEANKIAKRPVAHSRKP